MDMNYEFITLESAMWHHWYFGAEIICDGDKKLIDYK